MTFQEVLCQNGMLVSTDDEIKSEAKRFIREFLSAIPPEFKGV